MGPGNVGHLDDVLENGKRVAHRVPRRPQLRRVREHRPHARRRRPGSRSSKAATRTARSASCRRRAAARCRGRSTTCCAEVRAAVESGRVEIELLGQTVNAYRCPVDRPRLRRAARAVAEIAGVVRLRFMTSHPAEVSDSMIAAMRDHENISRYLHLPVQSGSSRVLRRMKRLYTREKYLETIARIREADPGHSLLDRHHRRLPRRDRGGLPGDAVASSRRCATARCSRSSIRRGRARRR